MKPIRKALFFVIPVLLIACDPGISIHQIKSQDKAALRNPTTDTQVVVNIITTHQLIGETWYAPKVEVTNASGSPVTVTNVELLVRGTQTYPNKTPEAGAYPTTIKSGSTEALGVYFRLDEDVQKTFKDPTELLVYYKIGEKNQIARATVIRGRLQETR